MGIIDHIGLAAADFDRSLAFYAAALKPLGISLIVQFPADGPAGQAFAGFGRDGKPELWISPGGRVTPRVHLAFTANSRAEVDAFYAVARSAGGVDNGAPGVRAHYHPNYYGAYVLDPDGHNIEAVCHFPA
jgi:catechol 2,3-dioxygenase-like lactoylglutathione lyase family enzyme